MFLAVIVWLEDTFTTAGSNFAARSAKLSGAARAMAGCTRVTDGVTRAKDPPSKAALATEARIRRMIGFPGE